MRAERAHGCIGPGAVPALEHLPSSKGASPSPRLPMNAGRSAAISVSVADQTARCRESRRELPGAAAESAFSYLVKNRKTGRLRARRERSPTVFLFLAAMSYAGAVTRRQKSGADRLRAVWNYANVASIGQYDCPIREPPVSPAAFHTPFRLDRARMRKRSGGALSSPNERPFGCRAAPH